MPAQCSRQSSAHPELSRREPGQLHPPLACLQIHLVPVTRGSWLQPPEPLPRAGVLSPPAASLTWEKHAREVYAGPLATLEPLLPLVLSSRPQARFQPDRKPSPSPPLLLRALAVPASAFFSPTPLFSRHPAHGSQAGPPRQLPNT